MTRRKPKVIVVGAGLAGLAAAYELCKTKKFNVEVLEARERVGGRVHSIEINGKKGDTGGFIIYPWYREYHRYLKELGMKKDLHRFSPSQIYSELEPGEYTPESDIHFPFSVMAMLYAKSLPRFFRKSKVGRPNLKLFHGQTIQAFLRSAVKRGKATSYERYINMVGQGYCYGPIDEYKMAFAAPIAKAIEFQGDVQVASYLDGYNEQFPLALARSIEKFGGKIHVGAKVTSYNDGVLRVGSKTHKADYFVFAQPAYKKLYEQILPGVNFGCTYTHYYNGVLKFDQTPSVNDTAEWGAVFYAPHKEKKFEILSSVNAAMVVGSALDGYIDVNVIAREKATKTRSKKQLYDELRGQIERIFPDSVCYGFEELIHWPEAMPVAQESFVTEVRERQGENGCYFAGDYLGAPSMEAALQTGVRAAKMILKEGG